MDTKKRIFNLILAIFFFVTIIFSLQPLGADVISVNAGGSNQTAITTDKYIEGFFFGAEEGAVCGNSVIETGETCDDGNVVSGDGCSSTCQTEVVTPPGGGGPGGGRPTISISVIPSEFNIDLAVNTQTERTVQIRNSGTSAVTLAISQQELQGMVQLGNTTLTIQPGQAVNLKLTFFALNETGFFTGKILVGSEEVLVALNVKTEILLFDSNIIVLNRDYKVEQEEPLRTLVTLIPLGSVEKTDVTLNYVIKDYSGKVFLTKSETLLIDKQTGLGKEFDTGLLPVGDYIVGLELVYPNGVAPSSAHFQIVAKGTTGIIGNLILYLVSLILLVLITILSVLIWRRLRNKEDEIVEEVVQ